MRKGNLEEMRKLAGIVPTGRSLTEELDEKKMEKELDAMLKTIGLMIQAVSHEATSSENSKDEKQAFVAIKNSLNNAKDLLTNANSYFKKVGG